MSWDGISSSVTIRYNAIHTVKVPQVHLNSDFQGFGLCQESGSRGVVSPCFGLLLGQNRSGCLFWRLGAGFPGFWFLVRKVAPERSFRGVSGWF